MNKKQCIIDAKLVAQYQEGNNNALAMLVKRWHKKMCNKSYWLVKDPDAAKDIAQESWKVILDKINDLKDLEKFGNWALRIVYSKSIDYLKLTAKERLRKEELHYETQNESIKENIEDNIKIKQALLKAISQLNMHQQMVLKLFYVEDYSLKEISEMLNISVGTTKSRLFHAREKLKIELNKNKEKY